MELIVVVCPGGEVLFVCFLSQMSTREHIVQQIMLNEVICMRKAALDQLFDGLCALRFNELFQAFPKDFECLLCASSAQRLEVTPDYLIDMVHADCTSPEETTTYEYLKVYLSSLDQKGV